jgi:hypothetical protein
MTTAFWTSAIFWVGGAVPSVLDHSEVRRLTSEIW